MAALEMIEREVHVSVDFDDRGQRRVRVTACEPKAIRQLQRDKRFKTTQEVRNGAIIIRIFGIWTGGAFPYAKFFPAHFRGKGDTDTDQEEFDAEEHLPSGPHSKGGSEV